MERATAKCKCPPPNFDLRAFLSGDKSCNDRGTRGDEGGQGAGRGEHCPRLERGGGGILSCPLSRIRMACALAKTIPVLEVLIANAYPLEAITLVDARPWSTPYSDW